MDASVVVVVVLVVTVVVVLVAVVVIVVFVGVVVAAVVGVVVVFVVGCFYRSLTTSAIPLGRVIVWLPYLFSDKTSLFPDKK